MKSYARKEITLIVTKLCSSVVMVSVKQAEIPAKAALVEPVVLLYIYSFSEMGILETS